MSDVGDDRGALIYREEKWSNKTLVLASVSVCVLSFLLPLCLRYKYWTIVGLGATFAMIVTSIVLIPTRNKPWAIYSKGVEPSISPLEQILSKKKGYIQFSEIIRISPMLVYQWSIGNFETYGYEIETSDNKTYRIVVSPGFGVSKLDVDRLRDFLIKGLGEDYWEMLYTEKPPITPEEFISIEKKLKKPYKQIVTEGLCISVCGFLLLILYLFTAAIWNFSLLGLLFIMIFSFIIALTGVGYILTYHTALGKYKQLKKYEEATGKYVCPTLPVSLPQEDYLAEAKGYTKDDWKRLEKLANNYKFPPTVSFAGMLLLAIGLSVAVTHSPTFFFLFLLGVILIVIGFFSWKKSQEARMKIKNLIKLEHKTKEKILPAELKIIPTKWLTPMVIYREKPILTEAEIEELRVALKPFSEKKIGIFAVCLTLLIVMLIFLIIKISPYPEHITLPLILVVIVFPLVIATSIISGKWGYAHQKLVAIKDYEEETCEKILPDNFK